MMRPIPADILEAAHETTRLEFELHQDATEALRKGIAAALAKHERHVRMEDSERAAKLAEDLDVDTDDDLATDGVAALLTLARQLREELPPDEETGYVPTQDDLIELILVGTVVTGEPGSGRWSVITADFSSIDLDKRLSGQVMVRLIRRSGHAE